MRVVVAGSSGLIGAALVALLRHRGHDVLRLVRRRPAAPDEHSWDPPAAQWDAAALDGADAVVNLCGSPMGTQRWTGERKQRIRDSRIVPTEVLATAVADHKVPVLVNGSAVGYYGDTGSDEADETAEPGRGFLATLVRDWEAAAGNAERAGARVVYARTGVVLSPSGGMLGRLRPLFALGLGGRLGNGRQYLPWISLDDEVGALLFALEDDGIAGPVNLTGPEAATNAEFTAALGAALHRPTLFAVPPFALRLAVGAELADEMALGSQRITPGVLRSHGYPFQHPTLAAALAAALE